MTTVPYQVKAIGKWVPIYAVQSVCIHFSYSWQTFAKTQFNHCFSTHTRYVYRIIYCYHQCGINVVGKKRPNIIQPRLPPFNNSTASIQTMACQESLRAYWFSSYILAESNYETLLFTQAYATLKMFWIYLSIRFYPVSAKSNLGAGASPLNTTSWMEYFTSGFESTNMKLICSGRLFQNACSR